VGVGSNPTGSTRRASYEGAAQIAGHLAAKVPDAAALHRLRCPKKLNVRSAAYFDILPSAWAAFVLQGGEQMARKKRAMDFSSLDLKKGKRYAKPGTRDLDF
jgi:hypothetical protein